METITISKGNQYDSDGYYLSSSNGMYAFGVIEDGRVTFDGTWSSADKSAVLDVIRQVLADGTPRQLTVSDAATDTDHRPISEYPYGSRGSRDDCE